MQTCFVGGQLEKVRERPAELRLGENQLSKRLKPTGDKLLEGQLSSPGNSESYTHICSSSWGWMQFQLRSTCTHFVRRLESLCFLKSFDL